MNEISTTLEAFLAGSNGYVLVDFYTNWCQPCKLLGPVLSSLETELPHVAFWKADIEALRVSDIQSVPTLVVYKDGVEVDRCKGLSPRPQLKKWLEGFK